MNEEQLISRLRENGYKITPQRIAICKIVLSNEKHPNAEQIFEEIKRKHPAISMTTVYHTLDMLKEMGMLTELRFNSQPSRFDPNTSVHINIICKGCGVIWDYSSDTLRNKWNHIISEIGKQPIGQRLDVYIICDDCKKNLHQEK
ncbi:MAG: transcriptional repressor [Candidatus Thorarchaeota archaeon]|nr:transcriptional repressor [Candidatus Thorarchaeota archaeon]